MDENELSKLKLMDVEMITYYNIDELFDILVNIPKESSLSNETLGNKLPLLYNAVSITIQLANVSMMEYYFLKRMYSPYITQLINIHLMELTENTKLDTLLSKYLKFVSAANSDGDMEYPYIYKGTCQITITGSHLYNIFSGSDPRFLIMSIMNKTGLTNVKDIYSNEKALNELNQVIIHNFITNFYKDIKNFLSITDPLSDYILNKMVFDQIDNQKEINLIGIKTPGFSFSFLSDDLNELMNVIEITTPVNSLYSDFDDHIYFEFLLNIDIISFLSLIQFLPFEAIKSTVDLHEIILDENNSSSNIDNDKLISPLSKSKLELDDYIHSNIPNLDLRSLLINGRSKIKLDILLSYTQILGLKEKIPNFYLNDQISKTISNLNYYIQKFSLNFYQNITQKINLFQNLGKNDEK